MELPKPDNFSFDKRTYKEVDRLESSSGNWITIIAQKVDSTFTYFTYHWDLSDFEYIEEGYWYEYDTGSFFDSIETALPDAFEDLKCKSGEVFFNASDRGIALKLAKNYAKRIVEGKLRPYEGAKLILDKVIDQCDEGVCSELNYMAGLEDEYSEFQKEYRLEFYGQQKIKELLLETESKIIAEAKAILDLKT